MASVRAKRFIGLGLLGIALAGYGTARAQAPADPEAALREQLLRLRQLPGAQEIITDFGLDAPLAPDTLGIGVAAGRVDETMRAQLNLPEKQGVVVTDVAPGGPADKAGLKPHDILLKLGDDPVTGPEDLERRFRDGGEEPVEVLLLRGGKETTVRVTPRPSAAARPYFIGVTATPLPDALRAQLGLPEDQGVIAGDILPDGPADKAGIRAHDILLTVDGQPVHDVDGLVAQLQEIKDGTVPVKLLRGGREKTVEVTPEKRPEPVPGPTPERTRTLPRDFRIFGPGGIIGPDGIVRPVPVPVPRGLPGALGMPPRQFERRLDEMSDQIKELRKAVEELQKATDKE